MKILVVDDELPMRTAITEALRAETYKVTAAENGEQALEKALTTHHDLILLDVMMPILDGFATCRELRKRGLKTPIIMLTARGTIDDRVNGLDSGADDYLVKPFSLKELLARVRAQLRKTQRQTLPDTLKIGRATLDLKHRTITNNNKTTPLNTKETGILTTLLENKNQVVTRDQILNTVWEYNAYPSTRTVDNFITELRKKLGENAKSPTHLQTIRGEGYRLNID